MGRAFWKDLLVSFMVASCDMVDVSGNEVGLLVEGGDEGEVGVQADNKRLRVITTKKDGFTWFGIAC